MHETDASKAYWHPLVFASELALSNRIAHWTSIAVPLLCASLPVAPTNTSTRECRVEIARASAVACRCRHGYCDSALTRALPLALCRWQCRCEWHRDEITISPPQPWRPRQRMPSVLCHCQASFAPARPLKMIRSILRAYSTLHATDDSGTSH
jgi:hypothetical protein